MTEWKDLTDPEELFRLHKAGWEIERNMHGVWEWWDGRSWTAAWSFHGRPPQPKTRTVTLEMWLHTDSGSTTTRLAGNTDFEDLPGYCRFPAGDITGEVEDA